VRASSVSIAALNIEDIDIKLRNISFVKDNGVPEPAMPGRISRPRLLGADHLERSTTMQHEHAERSIGMLLLNWVWYHLARRAMAMRAKHKAVVIAAFTAGSGNPPGA
jgi:hypothetical protein